MAVAWPMSSFLVVCARWIGPGGGKQKRALQDVRVHAPECALFFELVLAVSCARDSLAIRGRFVVQSEAGCAPYTLWIAGFVSPVRSARRAYSWIQLLR